MSTRCKVSTRFFYPIYSKPYLNNSTIENNALVYCDALTVQYAGLFLGGKVSSYETYTKIDETRKTITWYNTGSIEWQFNENDYQYFYIGIGR